MDYRTVYQGGREEIVEKKSRFIAEVFPVETEEEALVFLEKTRKKYWDARHHCWAFVIGKEQTQERFSDDGEPGGTAGKPILEVLRGQELCNVLLIVTRYFGGTLLGTGGLVRAYTKAAQSGLAASTLITKRTGYKLEIRTDYSTFGKLQYLLAEQKVPVAETIYAEEVAVYVLVSDQEEQNFTTSLIEATNAQIKIQRDSACCFACTEEGIVLFET